MFLLLTGCQGLNCFSPNYDKPGQRYSACTSRAWRLDRIRPLLHSWVLRCKTLAIPAEGPARTYEGFRLLLRTLFARFGRGNADRPSVRDRTKSVHGWTVRFNGGTL